MYKRAFVCLSALIVLSAQLIYWKQVRTLPEDGPAFEKFYLENRELHKRHALEKEPAHQLRQKVQKEIWTQDESYYARIDSEESDLTLSLKKDRPEAFELLSNIRCTLQNECLIFAKKGKFEPGLLTLEGDVRLVASNLQGKESYALADKLIYNPIEKTLLFTSSKKVLFWQDGFHLSAEEILIKKDQTVEGKGDVHFSFDLEENHSIEQFLKHYL